MYFIFSKILLFLLFPLSWVLFFLFIALFWKKPKLKRRSLVISVVLLLVFSNRAILSLFARNYDIAPVALDKKKVYSSAIILGGFSGNDNHGNGVFNSHADRFIQGIRLQSTGQVSHLLVSGGNGNLRSDEFREGGWVKGQLKQLKFPDSVILIEQQSRNTLENAAFSREILQKAHLPPPYLLVTSAWHMRRSLYIFKKAGLEVIPYPCDYVSGNDNLGIDDWLIPDSNTLAAWNLYLKEVVGLIVTHFKT